jgi:hypothetical protein
VFRTGKQVDGRDEMATDDYQWRNFGGKPGSYRQFDSFAIAADRSPLPAAPMSYWRRFSCFPPSIDGGECHDGGASRASRRLFRRLSISPFPVTFPPIF